MSSENKKNLFILIYAVVLIGGFTVMISDICSRDAKAKSIKVQSIVSRFVCEEIDNNQ
jgi:hypothetical protein